MRIELTIKTTYLPTWGAWEGIRELVQNGRDAEVEFSAPLSVTHVGQTLRIENDGAELPHEALLLGYTSKDDRADLIGKFGEGLKLGILALVRAGRPVKIRSGNEVWTPTIARSEKFHADVLVFEIQGGREPKRRVRIEIGGVTEVEWADMKHRFLFLTTPRKGTVVKTYAGDLLLADEMKGKLYVKGIFVQHHPKLQYGYNFNDVNVDRDRRMVHGYDIDFQARQVWREVVGQRPDLFGDFYDMLEGGAEDVRGFDVYAVSNLSQEILERASARFQKVFGQDAIPVVNLAESADVEHLGKRGVVVKPQLAAVLQKKLGTVDEVKARLAEEVVKTYSWNDLSLEEQTSLCDARNLMVAAGVAGVSSESMPDVVDFRSQGLEGQYSNGHILVARKVLVDRDLTLEVLVHEYAHACGEDGAKSHVAAIERSWSQVARHLRAKV